MRTKGQLEEFHSAIEAQDWRRVIKSGTALLPLATPSEQVDIYLQISLALEHMGQWLQVAPYAARGVAVCDSLGVVDQRLFVLLRCLGRGLWERQQYPEALDIYRRLLTTANDIREQLMARMGIGCCLERLARTRDDLMAALEQYRIVVDLQPDPYERLAAASNCASLLMHLEEVTAAHDLVSRMVLHCPPEHKQGAAWADLLRVAAEIELVLGRPEVAHVLVADAIETCPGNRPAVLALAHAVRALVELELGQRREAAAALECAWGYAELAPSVDVVGFLRQIESRL